MAAAYEMESVGDGWRMDGVQYGTKPSAEPVNFIVHDFGCRPALSEKINDAALLIAVCGTKHYELPNPVRFLKRSEATDAYVLSPFTHEAVRSDYVAILQSDFHKVLFLDYQPEPTDGMSNSK